MITKDDIFTAGYTPVHLKMQTLADPRFVSIFCGLSDQLALENKKFGILGAPRSLFPIYPLVAGHHQFVDPSNKQVAMCAIANVDRAVAIKAIINAINIYRNRGIKRIHICPELSGICWSAFKTDGSGLFFFEDVRLVDHSAVLAGVIADRILQDL